MISNFDPSLSSFRVRRAVEDDHVCRSAYGKASGSAKCEALQYWIFSIKKSFHFEGEREGGQSN